MKVLGIETSCDETSVAVIEENSVLSNIISSQEVHAQFGGVVPELASRAHIRLMMPIVKRALQETGATITDMQGLAVTYGPGLVGALLVGLNFAKGVSQATGKPFIGVNHMEGHIYGNLLSQKTVNFPIIFLIVSGGHTMLVKMDDHLKYKLLGRTRDDAVGEAFDKGAKLLGLGYPGGPAIDRLAAEGDPDFFNFPRAHLKNDPFGFSYSGLKTALLVYLKDKTEAYIQSNLNHICAAYQQAAVEILVKKTILAARKFNIRQIAIAGGVAANSRLRKWLSEEAGQKNMKVYLPEPKYCTDNAAMIARAGYEYLKRGMESPNTLNTYPALELQSIAD
ncbi:MAG: tRNA (adenosine(37)-N6)-threonylcarbamoyltransferase complex transferase subunit TsaD [Caldithrix sp.]|nr:tRNA (adenosine(37)-N6)-threonylcarbamoyltransferase complex transferase subunit TsaD [Caldithrix sp.]